MVIAQCSVLTLSRNDLKKLPASFRNQCDMAAHAKNLSLEPSVWFFAGQTSPSGPIRRVELKTSPMSIGRADDAGLTLPCNSVSKMHAEIFEHEGELWVRDLGSTNGTYVNGQSVDQPMTLTEGDILQVATLVFRVGRDITPDENDNATVTQDACDQALSLMQFDRLIQGDAVIPFYQPIVSISDDSFPAVAYEVLGRSRLIGLTTPGEMFATAAQLNLESELSRIFRGRGVELAREFPGAVCLYVNTHPRELENELVQSLYDLRAQNPDQDIVLEIHEAAVTNSAAIRKLRDALSDLGMGLAFDDFGAGQARLVELSEVQPDCLKFDMGLIQGIHSAPASRQQVVGSLIKMVNDLGIDSLVEGVETKEDHETLRQMGAKLGQGFYYGRPASVSDSIKQLATVAQS